MSNLGLIRVAAASPKLKVANVDYNTEEIIACMQEAEKGNVGIIVFPELCITGYTCADLFYQTHLYEQNIEGLRRIMEASKGKKTAVMIGFYLRVLGNFYNCAAFVQNGKILGVAPKMFIPNYQEFYEGRWFASGADLVEKIEFVTLFGEKIPFGNIVFRDETAGLSLGLEICEDLWVPITPGTHLSLNGADIILNLSASDETVGKASYRRNIIASLSSKDVCGYVYASAGVYESTTDLVFSGHTVIAETGSVLEEGKRFSRDSVIITADMDFQRIQFERSHSQTFIRSLKVYGDRERYVTIEIEPLQLVKRSMKLLRGCEKNPFVPSEPEELKDCCQEIFSIQTAALAKRVEHSRAKKCIIGISGGLDSTLALLVTVKTLKLLNRPATDIVAVTMPGFGTTGKTYQNALTIMKLLGTDVREIPIGEAVLKHFEDIGHDKDLRDLTYENCQARERTQILMDLSNKEDGIVIGTGDLSEMALGWCTYNGDHMSMYGVNGGVPKTLVKFVVEWVKDSVLDGENEDRGFSSDNGLLKRTLQEILDTPISPELLPPDESGDIAQKTEDSVGPYMLHDFFIYNTLRYGMPPKKLLYMACHTFENEYDKEFIKKWLKIFYQRFFSQQFKRSCMPDGPKVGSVSLSPRGDWRMPSDADATLWLKELE